MKYYLTINKGKGEPKEVHGPYDTHRQAFTAGQALAEDGGMVEVHTNEIICDFCSKPSVKWTYPAADFVSLSTMWGSAGDWAACNACHDLIEAGDRKGLTARSVDGYFKYGPNLLPDNTTTRALLNREISLLHTVFMEARTGAVHPEVPPRG